MKNRKVLIAIIILLIIGFTVAEIAIIRTASNYEPKIEVVYAKVQILPKTAIKEEMLEVRKVNISDAHKLAVRKKEEVVGRKAGVTIEDGEMLLSTKVVDEIELEDIKVNDKNNQLFAVEFKPDQINGWWLKVSQYVDVIYVPNKVATGAPTPANQPVLDVNISNINTVTQVVEKLRVAAIIDDKFKQLKIDDTASIPKYVVLEVTPEQARFLAYCKSNGRLEAAVVSGKSEK